MKELAYLLLEVGAGRHMPVVNLLSRSYYAGLAKYFLQAPAISSTFKAKIHVIDSQQDMLEVVEKAFDEHPERVQNMVSKFRFDPPRRSNDPRGSGMRSFQYDPPENKTVNKTANNTHPVPTQNVKATKGDQDLATQEAKAEQEAREQLMLRWYNEYGSTNSLPKDR